MTPEKGAELYKYRRLMGTAQHYAFAGIQEHEIRILFNSQPLVG